MEKFTEDKLTALSKALEVPVDLTPDTEVEGKIRPSFNPGAILSKVFALFVYSGWNAGANLPSYTSVHADVEFWKKFFAEQALASQAADAPAAPPKTE